MKRIIRVLLIVVVVVCAAYFLLIDYTLKSILESEGSKALTARLDIGSVTFHIVPTSIRLNAVQVTNPQQPMRNLLQLDSLAAPIDIGALIDRKIDLPELQLHGLRFNNARAQSGAIAGLTPASVVDTEAALPDSAQLALQEQTQQQQRLQGEIDKTRTDLTAILAKWQQRARELPDVNRIEEYRQRAVALRSANKSAELAQLRAEVNNQLGTARKLTDDFELDMQHARAQLAYAQAIPQDGFRAAGNNFSGGATGGASAQDLNNITGVLLGAEFKPVLAAITRQIAGLSGRQKVDNTALPVALLIRKTALDGQLDLGEQPLLFAGTIENLTPQPQLWNVATTFTLAGMPTQPSQFSAQGSIDLRKTPRIDIRFNLRQFPLQKFILSNNPRLGIVVDHALADIQGLVSSTGNQIDLNVISRFQQAALTVQATADTAAQTMAGALQGIDAFDVNVQARGNVQQPVMTLNSSLTPLLAAALNRQLQNRDGAAPGLDPALQQQVDGIHQLASDFDELQRQLLARQAALQSIAGS